MTRKTSKREKGITLIALIVTIIVLLILAGVTIDLAVSNQGIIKKAKTATSAYKDASEKEKESLALLENEIDKYIPKNDDSKVDDVITYTDSSGNTKPLTKDTPAGTKIGTTANIDGQTLNWYLFDVSADGKTAYLVSTPTYWVPDTTKEEVSGAWVPKLISASSFDFSTGAMNQAIQKKASATSGGFYSYSYDSSKVTYTPSESSLNYYKSVNSQWSAKRGSTPFASLNENEQEACYLADEDIFAGIKDQVNKADGYLKGKIQTLVGGASVEQWCKAYNNQAEVKNDTTKQITCEYSTTNAPGYDFNVKGPSKIYGDYIYGAAYTNEHSFDSTNPFSNLWLLASPYSYDNATDGVCHVDGDVSGLNMGDGFLSFCCLSLFASVAL